MAIYQPSNIIPSNFAGVGLGTIDATDKVSISWQVNGNSPMTAFQIQIYNNATNALVKNTGKINDGIPTNGFYGVDNKGNPQQFIYAPTDNNENPYTWDSSEWGTTTNGGIINGNEYKMIITQYWGNNDANSITQFSGSVFLTRSVPTLTLLYKGDTFDGNTVISSAVVNFSANYNQAQNDSINAIRWEFADDEGKILDDTGFINTGVFSYSYNGLFSGNDYAIRCTVETQNGVQATTGWISFLVQYDEASNTGDLKTHCINDGSVLLEWGKSLDIPGALVPEGTPNIKNNVLTLEENQSVVWDKVNEENMSFASPWNMLWEGKIGSIATKSYEMQPVASVASHSFRVNQTFSQDRQFIKSGESTIATDESMLIAYGNNKWVGVNKNATFISDNGLDWIKTSTFSILYEFYDLLYDGKSFIAYGRQWSPELGVILKSTNGNSWEVIVDSSAVSIQSLSYFDVNYNKKIYVRLASYDPYGVSMDADSYIETSSNLIEWNRELKMCGNSRYDIIGNRAFVYLGNNYFILIDYTIGCLKFKISNNGEYLEDSSFTFPSVIDSLAYDGVSTYCATSLTNNKIYYSTDLQNFGTITGFASGSLRPIQYDGGCFLVVDTIFEQNVKKSNVYYSEDGINWNFGFEFNYHGASIASKTTRTANYYEFLIHSINDNNTIIEKFIMPYFKYSRSITIEGWRDGSTSAAGNGLINYSYSTQSYANQPVTFTAWFDKKTVNVLFGYNTKSTTANVSHTFDFNLGTISKVGLSSFTPSSANISLSNTDNSITVTAVVNTTRTTTPKVNFDLGIIYNDLLNVGNNLIIETNAYQVYINKIDADVLYAYQLNIYDKTKSEYLISTVNGLQPTIGNYDLNIALLITPKSTILVYRNDYKQQVNYLTYTQEEITSISLIGPQVADILFLSNENIEYNANFEPTWNNNTLFYAKFYDLNAGLTSAGSNAANAIYRMDKNGLFLPVANVGSNITQLKDYGITSYQKYYYELLYLSGEESYSLPVKSQDVCIVFDAYYLIEATEDKDNPNVFHALKVWRFGNNISAGSVSNNNSPNWLTNFTPYRLKQPTSQLGESGTLQALLSNYNQSEDFYEDTVEMMQSLKQTSLSTNVFFLKDMKGNLYMVSISAPIVQTIATNTKLQQVSVSIPWEEIGDASNISLIQLPTDEGWMQDEVFDAALNVDLSTGKLKANYPYNYNGTTFALETNKLIANTPSGINGANLKLENGKVIAETSTENS